MSNGTASVTDLRLKRFRRNARKLAGDLLAKTETAPAKDDVIRLVIEVPRSWLWLATWLTHCERHRKRGELGPLYAVHNHYGINHEKRWFKDQLSSIMGRWFLDHTLDLKSARHPYLKVLPGQSHEDLDEDIPF
jgi:hypothetical protein